MMEMYSPPNISLTHGRPEIRRRFDDESATAISVVLKEVYAEAASEPPCLAVEPPAPERRVWKGPPFNDLAKSKPQKLLLLIGSNELSDHQLTFAAEGLGLIANAPYIVDVLKWLAGHKSPVVREGVVYGLARHVASSANARAILARIAKDDSSPEVRAAAADALED